MYLEHRDELELPCKDKLVFDTKKQAEAAVVVVDWQHSTKVRAYLCRHCSLWHLASGS